MVRPRCGIDAIKQKSARGETAEVDDAAEVKFENLRLLRAQLNQIVVASDFEGVAAANERDMVGKLESPLDAVDRGVWLAAKISVTRDVHGDLIAARLLRKPKVQASPRNLCPKLVEGLVADDGVVLEG